MNGRSKKLILNLLYAFGANGITMLVSLLTTLVLPRFVSIEEYGYSQLYIFYTNYIGFLHFGIPDGIYLRYGGYSYQKLDKPLFRSQFWISWVMESVVVLISWNIFRLGASTIEKQYVFFMLLCAALVVLPRTFCQMVLQTTDRINNYGIMLIIEKTVFAGLILCWIFVRNLSFKTIILSDIIGKMLSFIYVCFICRDIIWGNIINIKSCLQELKLNIQAGSKLMLANIASLLLIGIIRIGIEYQWNIETYGKVSLAINISNFILVFINAIGIVIFPMLKKMPSSILPDLYQKLKMVLSVLFLGFLILYYPMQFIIKLWIPQYSISLKYMVLIFPMCVYESFISLLINTYMKSLRKESALAIINIISLVISIALTIISAVMLKNLLLAFIAIHIVYMLRFIIADKYLTQNMHIKSNNGQILFLCILFSILSWCLSIGQSCILYMILYIVYFVKNRKELIKAYNSLVNTIMK